MSGPSTSVNIFSDAWQKCQDVYNKDVVPFWEKNIAPTYNKVKSTCEDKYENLYVRNVERLIDNTCGGHKLAPTLKKIAKVAPFGLGLLAATLILPTALTTLLSITLTVITVVSIFKKRELATDMFNTMGVANSLEAVGNVAFAVFSSNPFGTFVSGAVLGLQAFVQFWCAHQISQPPANNNNNNNYGNYGG